MMIETMDRVVHGDLKVAKVLSDFIAEEVALEAGAAAAFWHGLSNVLSEFAPRNRDLLKERDDIQAKIDDWHLQHGAPAAGSPDYENLLRKIGYLVPEGADFAIDTTNVDPEVALTAGPQLVVPVSNARYALNAANARWGSLYDALYGSDALGDGPAQGHGYDCERGAKVIAWARDFLDAVVPLQKSSHRDAKGYAVERGALSVSMADGTQ